MSSCKRTLQIISRVQRDSSSCGKCIAPVFGIRPPFPHTGGISSHCQVRGISHLPKAKNVRRRASGAEKRALVDCHEEDYGLPAWKGIQASGLSPFPQTSAEDLHQTYLAFAKVVNGVDYNSAAALSLQKFSGIPPRLLFEAAITLPLIPTPRRHQLPVSIMSNVAGRAGHEPAFLTLALRLVEPKPKTERSPDTNTPGLNWVMAKLDQSAKDGNPNAKAIAARREFKQGHSRKATMELEKLVQTTDPRFELKQHAISWLAECYRALGNTEKAIQLLKSHREKYGGTSETLLQIAEAAQKSGMYEDARQLFYDVAMQRRDPQAYLRLGQLEGLKAEKETDKDSREDHLRWAIAWSDLSKAAAELDEADMGIKA